MTEEIVTKESSTTDSLRKAAILVSALNRDSADALLEKMGDEQAARVRNAVFELDIISDEEQDQIVREFVSAGGGTFDMMSNARSPEDEHVGARPFRIREYGDVADQETTPQSAAHSNANVESDGFKGHVPPSNSCPFPILSEASAETLATHLIHENAQVIAVVVAHLPPRRAADLIALLSPQRQADVLGRVAGLDAAVPAAIEVLQRQLEDKLSEEIRVQRSRDVGLAAVKSILDAAGSNRDELLDNLKTSDFKLSQQVARAKVDTVSFKDRFEPRIDNSHEKTEVEHQPVARRAVAPPPTHRLDTKRPDTTGPDTNGRDTNGRDDVPAGATTRDDQQKIQPSPKRYSNTEPLAFEQLAELDDEGLAVLFGELDPEITLVALAGASSEFVERVMQPLPPREARSLRRRMERLGPIRLSDIAAAQREVAQAATRLVQEGRLPKIVTPRFAVAA
jgi:flagellar motor switch protein FliG